MRIRAVIVFVVIAAFAGFVVGVRYHTSPSSSRINAPVHASSSDSTPSAARVMTTMPANVPPLLPWRDLRTTVEEEVEAMQRGDVSAVARSIVFTTEAKALIERAAASAPPELAREYPTAELLAAFVFCGAQRIEGFRVVSTTFEQPDLATQYIAFKFASEPEWRTEEIAFRYMAGGWCRVIDVGLAQRVAAIIGVRK